MNPQPPHQPPSTGSPAAATTAPFHRSFEAEYPLPTQQNKLGSSTIQGMINSQQLLLADQYNCHRKTILNQLIHLGPYSQHGGVTVCAAQRFIVVGAERLVYVFRLPDSNATTANQQTSNSNMADNNSTPAEGGNPTAKAEWQRAALPRDTSYSNHPHHYQQHIPDIEHCWCSPNKRSKSKEEHCNFSGQRKLADGSYSTDTTQNNANAHCSDAQSYSIPNISLLQLPPSLLHVPQEEYDSALPHHQPCRATNPKPTPTGYVAVDPEAKRIAHYYTDGCGVSRLVVYSIASLKVEMSLVNSTPSRTPSVSSTASGSSQWSATGGGLLLPSDSGRPHRDECSCGLCGVFAVSVPGKNYVFAGRKSGLLWWNISQKDELMQQSENDAAEYSTTAATSSTTITLPEHTSPVLFDTLTDLTCFSVHCSEQQNTERAVVGNSKGEIVLYDLKTQLPLLRSRRFIPHSINSLHLLNNGLLVVSTKATLYTQSGSMRTLLHMLDTHKDTIVLRKQYDGCVLDIRVSYGVVGVLLSTAVGGASGVNPSDVTIRASGPSPRHKTRQKSTRTTANTNNSTNVAGCKRIEFWRIDKNLDHTHPLFAHSTVKAVMQQRRKEILHQQKEYLSLATDILSYTPHPPTTTTKGNGGTCGGSIINGSMSSVSLREKQIQLLAEDEAQDATFQALLKAYQDVQQETPSNPEGPSTRSFLDIYATESDLDSALELVGSLSGKTFSDSERTTSVDTAQFDVKQFVAENSKAF